MALPNDISGTECAQPTASSTGNGSTASYDTANAGNSHALTTAPPGDGTFKNVNQGVN